LGPLVPKQVLGMGQSQSAHYLSTYVNAVDPLARIYDGFLIHGRGAGSVGIDGEAATSLGRSPVRFRPDLRVPVITVLAESDLLGLMDPSAGYWAARVPDNSRLRVWEMAGTAHSDNYLNVVGFIDSGYAP